jgi:Uma2 family endonuclease
MLEKAVQAPVVWTATVDDLARTEGKAELVDGRLVEMSPAGGIHGYVAGRIAFALADHERRSRSGVAFGDNVGFLVDLPRRRSFCPDAAYYDAGPIGAGFLNGAPVFAVEVRSPEDFGPRAERRMAEKRADYFAAGTQVVWDVDPLRARVVRSYVAAQPDRPIEFGEPDEAHAEPALPGWRVAVRDLMPPPDARSSLVTVSAR